MSLYKTKCWAIRQALVHDNFDALTKYMQKQGIEDMPYSQIAEYFITNGDSGLDADLEIPLRNAFVKYVDEHTTLPIREIEDIIDKCCNEDFLMDSWDDIADAHFSKVEFYDNVVYVIEQEWNSRKWEHTTNFVLYSTYEKAKEAFENFKGNAELDLNEISDNWVKEFDRDDYWVGQDNNYESYIEINFYKKGIN